MNILPRVAAQFRTALQHCIEELTEIAVYQVGLALQALSTIG